MFSADSSNLTGVLWKRLRYRGKLDQEGNNWLDLFHSFTIKSALEVLT